MGRTSDQQKGRRDVSVGEQPPGPRVGWLAGWRPGRGPLVDFAGNERGPLPALSAVALDQAEIQEAVSRRQGIVLLFECNDPSRPLLMGLLQTEMGGETPNLDLILEAAPGEDQTAGETPLEARVDGRRVLLEGAEEVVLRCGKACITLRRDGKIVIRGTYLVSRAEGTHRIKGGSVKIN